MAKCTNCKKPIPAGAKFCGHCGKPTGLQPNSPTQPPFVQYHVMPYGTAEQQNVQATTPAPNCDLSVAGFIMALFTPFILISFILSCAALSKKQVRRGLAIAGLIISLLKMVAFGVCIYLLRVVLPQLGIDFMDYFLMPW